MVLSYACKDLDSASNKKELKFLVPQSRKISQAYFSRGAIVPMCMKYLLPECKGKFVIMLWSGDKSSCDVVVFFSVEGCSFEVFRNALNLSGCVGLQRALD